MDSAPTSIQDHAVIGDCRSAALVSLTGSIDWLCWPRFDSPSLFAGLLDPDVGGHWSIAPVGLHRAWRRYLEDTNVLQTWFETAAGVVVVTDFMPVHDEEEKRHLLLPEAELVRLVECRRGEVEVEMVFDPRPEYGKASPRLRDRGPFGLSVAAGRAVAILRGEASLTPRPQGGAATRLALRAGQAVSFSLTWASEGPAVLPELGERIRRDLERTRAWWRDWAARATYRGPARDAVIRSALALKLMCHAPTGAIVASPTTSLPERVGGDMNWDYRFCWLRDASMSVRALFGLGYVEEAVAFTAWLLHTTRLTRPRLQVLYDVFGREPGREEALPHLAGYRGSRPVRIRNAASRQVQLDVYGEVIDATTRHVRTGGRIDRETQSMLIAFGEFVCRHWSEPDAGIWETRGAHEHHTHSRLMCWVALDRLLELHEAGVLPHAPAELFAEELLEIRRDIEEGAWNPTLGSYTRTVGGEDVDASLLLLAVYGFEDAASPRMTSTYRRILRELSPGGGLIHRNSDFARMKDGAFGICSFWAVEFLARGGGSVDEAARQLEEVLSHANDVGLFAEEVDPGSGDALGNFPQAFTHIGLINAALTLVERSHAEAGEPRAAREQPRMTAEPGVNP